MTIRSDLLTALDYSLRAVESYAYPSWEFRAQRISDINNARAWVLAHAPKETA